MKDVGFDHIPGIIRKKPALPTESQARKATPIFSGVLMYFPDALAAVAELSKKGNDKHNPGQPLHWSRGKSNDHADCVARHLIDIGKDWTDVDPEDGMLHATKVAWRALALLQVAIETSRERCDEGDYVDTADPVAEDGWINWAGGACPVGEHARVEVLLRNGAQRITDYAGAWRWVHTGEFGDIVAYRVVK